MKTIKFELGQTWYTMDNVRFRLFTVYEYYYFKKNSSGSPIINRTVINADDIFDEYEINTKYKKFIFSHDKEVVNLGLQLINQDLKENARWKF